jgi:hypothetical protein
VLRFFVCGLGVYIAFAVYNWRKLWATSCYLVFIAFLFNPLIPICLSGKIWQSIDVVCAGLFIVVGLVLKKSAQYKNDAD